jgi:hypothetical protein
MGASEGLMSRFAARLKQGRSWNAAGVESAHKSLTASMEEISMTGVKN